MKAAEVHKLSPEELKVEANRLRRKLFDLRVQTVTEKIADTSQFRKTRKDLARVLTEANGRTAGATDSAKKSAKKSAGTGGTS
ncbi:MAG: 50S ribosomal protein L29 [Phycisphaerae bacterium]|nr:50S ribosomal protein L29 [Phycisphaerae bacterium]